MPLEFGANTGPEKAQESGGETAPASSVKDRLDNLDEAFETISNAEANIHIRIAAVEKRFGLPSGTILNIPKREGAIEQLLTIFEARRYEEISYLDTLPKNSDVEKLQRLVKDGTPEQIIKEYLKSKNTTEDSVDSPKGASWGNLLKQCGGTLLKGGGGGFAIAFATPFVTDAVVQVAPFMNGRFGHILDFAGISVGLYMMGKSVWTAAKLAFEYSASKKLKN